MATYYLDLENGNDANDGTTFALRKKTFASLTAPAAGDTVRVMASPDPTLIGNATWTQYSKTITLAAAVTANIANCDTAWTASTNVTATTTATCKQGTAAANIAITASFTTGKIAYFATGALDLSAYQQVSFWIKNSAAIANATTLSLRLCSDALGATTVNTLAIPAIPSTAQWVPVTVDTGAALGSSIQSIALYAATAPGTQTINLDCIVACKASAAADSLSLTSLIGKVHNLSWVASTAYSLNDKRRPTQPNRNGFQYQVTTAGTTGSNEPEWPAYWGGTVTDGSVVWTCVANDLEDSWFGIQSISGATVMLDMNTNNTASGANRGYQGATESVASYKRETTKTTMVSSSATVINTSTKAGTSAAGITYSGGWDRVSMGMQSGETWFDAQNGLGYAFVLAHAYVTFLNLNAVRASNALVVSAAASSVKGILCHGNNSGSNGFVCTTTPIVFNGFGCSFNMNFLNGMSLPEGSWKVTNTSTRSNASTGASAGSVIIAGGTLDTFVTRNNGSSGVNGGPNVAIRNLASANNANGVASTYGGITLFNCLIPEGIASPTASVDAYTYSQNHNQIADNHLITTDGGTIVSATDQRHTATGISWKFRPASTTRDASYPLKLSVAKIGCAANTAVTVSIWVYRSSTNIQGQIYLQGGQIAGVGADVTTACAPTINTWTQYSLTFTPTDAGAVEVLFRTWDGVGTTNNLWIDDLSIT